MFRSFQTLYSPDKIHHTVRKYQCRLQGGLSTKQPYAWTVITALKPCYFHTPAHLANSCTKFVVVIGLFFCDCTQSIRCRRCRKLFKESHYCPKGILTRIKPGKWSWILLLLLSDLFGWSSFRLLLTTVTHFTQDHYVNSLFLSRMFIMP